MKSCRILGILVPLMLMLFLAGCATPASRIKKNQALFDTFPVATQARIRGGKIDMGFTEVMTRIALGEPQRKLTRRTATTERTIWLYLDVIQQYERQHVNIDGLSLYGPTGAGTVGGSAWFNILQEREYLKIRAEFENGRIVAIEEPIQDAPKP